MADPVDSAPTLLVVEDDEALRLRLVRAFVDRGFLTQGAASTSEALRLTEETPEYAIVGKVTDGLDVVDRIGALGDPDTEQPLRPVVVDSVTVASNA